MTHTTARGDDKTLIIPMTWDGAPFVPGGDWAGIFTAKRKAADLDSAAAFQHASGGNLFFVGSNAILVLNRADTDGISPASLFVDIQVQHVTTGEVRTVALDRLKVTQDVTRLTVTSVPPNNTATPMPFGPAWLLAFDSIAIVAGDELELVQDGVTYFTPLYRRP